MSSYPMKQNWLFSMLLVFSSPATYAETPPSSMEIQSQTESPQNAVEKKQDTDLQVKTNTGDSEKPAAKDKKPADDDNKVDTKTTNSPDVLARRSTPPTPRYLQKDPEVSELEKNKQLLILRNSMGDEQLREENRDLLVRLQKLRWEKELLTEELELQRLKETFEDEESESKHQALLLELNRESDLASARELKLSSELATQRMQWELKTNKLQQELDAIRLKEERELFANKEPVYLDQPLTDDNTLIISDRRITLDGPILHPTADYITKRLNYFNNKDEKLPIFLVIESSPGGSAMAGDQIMRAIESSKAPVYVVVKSFAASMAAIITTSAEHSYAYPNAIIMHHQPVVTLFLASLNLTEQKEFYEDSKKWWDLMMEPIAKKMGLTGDEFIEEMYKHVSHGNWSEFATEAHKLKWVNHIVDRIQDSSVLFNPNADNTEMYEEASGGIEAKIEDGRSVMYLPRLNPKDPYFIYNPDGYYQVR